VNGHPDASDELSAAQSAHVKKDRLLTAGELASWLNVEQSFVYEHADELGAMRLGSGPRARLRFDLETVRAAISCQVSRESEPSEVASQAVSRRRRRTSLGTSVDLLPIRGRIPGQNGGS
jgi:hypothetical protein